jgi:hypothetical protein
LGDLPKAPVFVKTPSGKEEEISFEGFKKLKDTPKIEEVIKNLAEKLIDWHDKFKLNPPGTQSKADKPGQSNQPTPYLVSPMDPLGISDLEIPADTLFKGELCDDDKRRLQDLHEEHAWDACFTRRLHGENLMCIFWQNLENAYYQRALSQWNLKEILKSWFDVLEDYWKDSGVKISVKTVKSKKSKQKEKKENEFSWNHEKSKIKELIKSCPLFYENFKDEVLVMQGEEEEQDKIKFLKQLEELPVEKVIDEPSFFEEKSGAASREKSGQKSQTGKETAKETETMDSKGSSSGDKKTAKETETMDSKGSSSGDKK